MDEVGSDEKSLREEECGKFIDELLNSWETD
jgi:hypothetical protein